MSATRLRTFDARLAAGFAAVLLLSLLEYRVTMLVHAGHIESLIDATEGVTTGEPHWRGYQSRVLGPFALLHLGSVLGIDFGSMVILAMMVLPAACNFVFFEVVRRLTGETGVALRTTVLYVAGFLLLQDPSWLYVWDYLDLIVLTLFVYGALARERSPFFVILFAVGILNRESALFIALWMMIDALLVQSVEGGVRPGVRDRRRVVLGGALLVAGVAVVQGLRRALFVEAAGVRAGIEQVPLGPLGLTRLGHNLETLVDQILAPGVLLEIGVAAAVVAVPVWLLAHRGRFSRDGLPVAATALALWGATLVFGLVDEARVWLGLVPLVLLLQLDLSGSVVPRRTGGAGSGSPAPAPGGA